MGKKETGMSAITVLLVIILCGISGLALKSIAQYYYGPGYKIDSYVKYLNGREYEKIYPLLSSEATAILGNESEVVHYYKKIYERENKLVSVRKVACTGTTYTLQYQYLKNMEKVQIDVIKEKGLWKIKFPFQLNDVEIFAPLGSQVYLENEKMSYNQSTGKYELSDILPGTYLLKVSFDQEDYKDYYKALYIPDDKSFEVPYQTASVKINCAPYLKVSLSHFNKVANTNKVEFNNILLGEYQVKIEDKHGYLKTQEADITIRKGNNNYDFKEFALTEEGSEKLESFIEKFYDTYKSAIEKHDTTALMLYFASHNARGQMQLFSEWYIDKKDIEKVDFEFKVGEHTINDMGQICMPVQEIAILYNKEYDTILDQDVERCYRVILDFDVVISILEDEIKIIDRTITQSLVAVKDSDDNWTQY